MRIVSGKYKGRNLLGYDLKGTRPTMDRVKESLFAMLQEKLPGSTCLDLFAGSGNLGLEAFSQGAKKVVFVDHNAKATQTIQKNIDYLKVEENYTIIRSDFHKALTEIKNERFDIIFLDPPYATDDITKALEQIKTLGILAKDGYIVLESNEEKKVLPENYEIIKIKKYGDKYISIVQEKG